MITDFKAAKVTILFEAAARPGFIDQRGANLVIQFAGGNDAITVLNADSGLVFNFQFTNDIFLG